ncbi:non-specific lipid-transfer protein AP10 [Ziziphus jujuba]|uniref:Non-specific lipid-transfer protein AP10 n=1 Tax=Ziziphus jujuba TaxID=326968 RepID=A0A6P3ZIG8_ZIZJJ|nr:non-specific lipid-transfer protein AP10 [Ziziphus jujuba]
MEKKKVTLMVWSILGLGLAIMVLGRSAPENDITCQQALTDLLPCTPFLKADAGADQPGVPCCLGVQTVFQAANTTQIRRDLCGCFKKAAVVLGVKPERAKQIPTLCNIALTIPIDPSIDCSTINN